MASPGDKLVEGRTRLIFLEDGTGAEEQGFSVGPVLKQAAEEQNKTKQKTCLATHGTDSVHYVLLFLVPDITLKESDFSTTEFPNHIVFPLGLLLKQLFTTSVNTLEICSYTTTLSGLYLPPSPPLCFLNTRKTVQILIMF